MGFGFLCFSGFALAFTSSIAVGAGPEIGDQAPEIELEGLAQAPAGSVATMEALRGKVVVIEFWATWCVPCIAAFPHLNELVEHYEDSNDIVFIAITNESQETAAKVLDKNPLQTWHGFDTDGSIWKSYGVNAIPRTIIIGKDGRVAADTYPTRVSVEVLDQIRDGKEADLPSMGEMMGEDEDGGERDGGGSFGMPGSIAEMNQMQMQGTAPGADHKRLDALAGSWTVTESASPAGPMGPKLESESPVTREWIQGGRVLLETRRLAGADGVIQHTYIGFNAEEDAYYMCEISALEVAPVIWDGQWDEEKSTLEFTRSMEVQMMGMPGDDGGTSQEIELYLAFDLSEKDSYRTSMSIDFGSMGMGMPGGRQVMSESTAVRSGD